MDVDQILWLIDLFLLLIWMWIYNQFFTFLNIGRCAFCAIYCHSPETDTAVSLGAFYTICAHSSQRDTAMAMAEFALSVCSCAYFVSASGQLVSHTLYTLIYICDFVNCRIFKTVLYCVGHCSSSVLRAQVYHWGHHAFWPLPRRNR